jgi:serine/threonine protein phosphatase PrpC
LKENNIGPEKNVNIFGIFDGHSGNEISQYLSLHFTSELLKNENFKNGNYKQALIDSFKNIDKSFRTKEVNRKLLLYRRQNRLDKKEKMNDLYKEFDKNNLNKNDIDNLNNLMDIIDPISLEEVYISDFVGSSGIIAYINEKKTYIANAGNSHCIIIDKNMSVVNFRNLISQKAYDNKEKIRVKTSKGIKYGKEKEKKEENEEYLYTKGFGDFNYKDNNLVSPEQQEISPEPDVIEISNNDIQYLIICNYGFYEYGIQINKDDINKNIKKNIADYFIKKLQNKQKKISEIIEEYIEEFVPKENDNNQYYNNENLSCIIIDFTSN